MPQPYDYTVAQPDVGTYFQAMKAGRDDRAVQQASQDAGALKRYFPAAAGGDKEALGQVMGLNPEIGMKLTAHLNSMDEASRNREIAISEWLGPLLMDQTGRPISDPQQIMNVQQMAAQRGLPPDRVQAITPQNIPLLVQGSEAARNYKRQIAQDALSARETNASIAAKNAAADASRRSGQGGSGGMSNTTFDNVSGLRKEYISATKDFGTVTDAYGRIKATSAAATPAGDLSMIFAYMKMLDPNSVVRESEFALAQNAKPLIDRMGVSWDAVKSAWEGTKLQPQVRADFLKQSAALYGQQLQQKNQIDTQYTDLAKSFGFDPKFVVTGRAGMADAAGPPPPPPLVPQQVQRPTITGPNGQKMQLNAAGTAWEPMR